MASTPPPRSRVADCALFATVLAIAVVVLPLMFGPTITVSPLLLFAAAVIPNFIAYLIPATDENGGRSLFSRVFYLRMVASVIAAFLFLAIYRTAHALGAG